MKVEEFLVNTNKVLDYIPVVSTGTAIINLISKVVLDVFLCFRSNPGEFLGRHPYFGYLKEKPYGKTALLVVPLLNFFAADNIRNQFVRKECGRNIVELKEMMDEVRRTCEAFKEVENLVDEDLEVLRSDECLEKLKAIQERIKVLIADKSGDPEKMSVYHPYNLQGGSSKLAYLNAAIDVVPDKGKRKCANEQIISKMNEWLEYCVKFDEQLGV